LGDAGELGPGVAWETMGNRDGIRTVGPQQIVALRPPLWQPRAGFASRARE
jgi:hypothetical protein